MKRFFFLTILSALSTAAMAHPGSNKLVCRSASNSGSDQKVEINLVRSNGLGTYNPSIEISVNGKSTTLWTPDIKSNYGTTFHNSPLKVITVTADVPYKKKHKAGNFSIVAIPQSVKAFDIDGNPVEWSFEAEKDDCNDSNGKATFQGIFHGFIYEDDGGIKDSLDTQIMDCELSYNSGMAC